MFFFRKQRLSKQFFEFEKKQKKLSRFMLTKKHVSEIDMKIKFLLWNETFKSLNKKTWSIKDFQIVRERKFYADANNKFSNIHQRLTTFINFINKYVFTYLHLSHALKWFCKQKFLYLFFIIYHFHNFFNFQFVIMIFFFFIRDSRIIFFFCSSIFFSLFFFTFEENMIQNVNNVFKSKINNL